MAELLYALAVFALGIWLAYNANALGMHTAAWLAGGRIEYGRNSRIVRWHNGTLTLPRLALLYASGLAGTLVLLLALAGLMAVIFLLQTGISQPYEAINMVVTMFSAWAERAWHLAGIPFSPAYWAEGGILVTMTKAMVGHIKASDGIGGIAFAIAYDVGHVATLYLAASVIPLYGLSAASRALGQWLYAFCEDPALYGFRELSKLAYLIALATIILVESPLIAPTL